MSIVKPDTASHWYQRDGSPCHKVELKTKPGQYRNTNLSDARKFGLLPSVTNVIRILAKEGLEAWKIEQGIIAAVTMTDKEKEGLNPDEIAAKAAVMAREEVDVARVFGQSIHGSIENFVCSGEEPDIPKIQPYFALFKQWYDNEITDVFLSEQTVVGSSYAGRLDLMAMTKSYGLALIDFKTRKRGLPKTKAEKAAGMGKFLTYDEDIIQLAAYKMAVEGKFDTIDPTMSTPSSPVVSNVLSVFVDSREPTPVHVHQWEPEQVTQGEDAFLLLLQLWKVIKKYDPAKVA